MKRPLPDDITAARERTVPDVIAPGLRILFVGINPGIWSGATGFHFAKPGNRFWRAIHLAGLTSTLLEPDQSEELLRHGIGITNLVARTTAVASELTAEELRSGAAALEAKIKRFRPEKVAFLGVSSFRLAFEQPKAAVGHQDVSVGGSDTFVLPNPSGLNAHYQLADLALAYAALK